MRLFVCFSVLCFLILSGCGSDGGDTVYINNTVESAPGAPRSLSAIGGDEEISLMWSSPSDNGNSPITDYLILRSEDSTEPTTYTSTGSDVTMFTDTAVVNGTTYDYAVVAVNAIGSGEASEMTTCMPVGASDAPLNFAAVGGEAQVELTWDPPTDDGGSLVTEYTIYRNDGSHTWSLTVSGTSYTDTDVENGVTYTYIVTARNDCGESAGSDEQTVTPQTQRTVPSVVQNFAANGGDNQVALSWLAPLDDGGLSITGYTIYRTGGSGDLTFSITSTSFTDPSAVNGTTYSYTVAAVNAMGEGAMPTPLSVTPMTTPGIVRNFTAQGGNATVALSWDAPLENGGSSITGYTVYRSGGSSFTPVETSGTSYTDTTVVNGTTYTYTVAAVNTVGEGTHSAEESVTPAPPVTVPGSPQNLTPVGGDNTVALSWDAPASDGGSAVTGYLIYRTGGSGNVTLYISGTSYTDTSVVNGTQYSYAVSAVNAVGEGNPCAAESATPMTLPGAPTGFTATAQPGEVDLSWSAPSDDGGSSITGYKVYRSGGGSTSFTVSGTSYTDSSVTVGISYTYYVKAVNTVGEGASSASDSATPYDVPVRQQILSPPVATIRFPSPGVLLPGMVCQLLVTTSIVWLVDLRVCTR